MTIKLLAMISINPNAEEALDKYLGVVGPLMQTAGAKILDRFELIDSIAGKKEIQYVTLIEYPDEDAVKQVFDSEEYRSLDDVKRVAFSNYQVSMAVSI